METLEDLYDRVHAINNLMQLKRLKEEKLYELKRKELTNKILVFLPEVQKLLDIANELISFRVLEYEAKYSKYFRQELYEKYIAYSHISYDYHGIRFVYLNESKVLNAIEHGIEHGIGGESCAMWIYPSGEVTGYITKGKCEAFLEDFPRFKNEFISDIDNVLKELDNV